MRTLTLRVFKKRYGLSQKRFEKLAKRGLVKIQQSGYLIWRTLGRADGMITIKDLKKHTTVHTTPLERCELCQMILKLTRP